MGEGPAACGRGEARAWGEGAANSPRAGGELDLFLFLVPVDKLYRLDSAGVNIFEFEHF